MRDRDLGTLRQQHPDGNLQSPPGWIHDTDRPISSLRSAKNPQGNTMKRVKGVEDLNIRIVGAQGIVGVGAITRMCIWSCRAVVCRRMAQSGSRADRDYFLTRGGSLGVVPSAVPGDAGRGARRRPPAVLRRSCRGSPTRRHSTPIWRHCARSIGWSTQRNRSPGRSRCCAICRATPTASRSPIAG